MNDQLYCPECASMDVTRTTPVDDEGYAEFVCEECSEYFVAEAGDDDPDASPTEERNNE